MRSRKTKKERSFVEETGIKPKKKSGPFDFQDLNYLGSIFDTYIMACDADCFYLIDQHAAHEKVLYERIVKEMKEPPECKFTDRQSADHHFSESGRTGENEKVSEYF